jgi:hypothetical protein
MDHWALPAIAVMLIAYGAVSGRLRSTPISQAMVFVTLGLLAGNQLVGLVDADTVTQFVRHLAEATLTLVLFGDAVRVNRGRRTPKILKRWLTATRNNTSANNTVAPMYFSAVSRAWVPSSSATAASSFRCVACSS